MSAHERSVMACHFCGKEFAAASPKAAWHRVNAHEFGAHIVEHQSGPAHHSWVDHPHGNWQRYRKGCRCEKCTAANREKKREQRRKRRARSQR